MWHFDAERWAITIFQGRSGCWSNHHFLQEVRRHTLRLYLGVHNLTRKTKAFHISRTDHQSLSLSQCLCWCLCLLFCSVWHRLQAECIWIPDAFSGFSSACVWKGDYNLLLTTSLSPQRVEKFWPWNRMWVTSKAKNSLLFTRKQMDLPWGFWQKKLTHKKSFLWKKKCKKVFFPHPTNVLYYLSLFCLILWQTIVYFL